MILLIVYTVLPLLLSENVPTPSVKHNLFIVKSSPGGFSSSKFEFNDLGSYEWVELDQF